MALVNIDTALTDAIRLIGKSPINGGVEILSYKRNRTIAVIRLSEGRVKVIEKGYTVAESEIDLDQLAKKMKTMIKREFPRSRKVRFYKFTDPAELDRIHQKI